MSYLLFKVSKNAFYLRLHADPTQVIPADRYVCRKEQPYVTHLIRINLKTEIDFSLRNGVFSTKGRTVDNAYNYCSSTNIP